MSNQLTVNAETGFLESYTPYTADLERNYFNSDRKLHFLALVDECIKNRKWPTVNELCAIVGVGLRTFEIHLQKDAAFNQEWVERRRQLMSLYTSKLAEKADHKMGTLANLAMLRYLESGTWNPEHRINHVTNDSVSKSLFNGLNQVQDAEILPINQDNGAISPSEGSTHK